MKKENYFKRLKKKNKNLEEAQEILGETKTYLFISIGICVTSALLSGFIDSLSNILMTISGIGILPSVFFGFNFYATKRGIQRLKNLICDKCGSKLGDPENTEYEELGFYTLKTRALEVLNEIQDKLNSNKFLLKPKTGLLSKDDIRREKIWLEELNNIDLITENSLCSIEPIGNPISVYEMPEK